MARVLHVLFVLRDLHSLDVGLDLLGPRVLLRPNVLVLIAGHVLLFPLVSFNFLCGKFLLMMMNNVIFYDV